MLTKTGSAYGYTIEAKKPCAGFSKTRRTAGMPKIARFSRKRKLPLEDAFFVDHTLEAASRLLLQAVTRNLDHSLKWIRHYVLKYKSTYHSTIERITGSVFSLVDSSNSDSIVNVSHVGSFKRISSSG